MFSILPKHFRAALHFVLVFFCAGKLAAASPSAMSGDAAIQSALGYFNHKNYDAALSALAPALQSPSQGAEALNLKGAILTKQKNYDAALACYNQALKASPAYFPARYNVGALLALRHQWDAAIDYYRNLLIDQPNNELVEYKLLLLLIHQNADPELQAKLFATDLPTNTPAWYYATAARCYKKGEVKEAAKYTETAKNIYGDQTDIFQEELDESGLNKNN
jgi:tetratricopeptide (TPR) repeat protein